MRPSTRGYLAPAPVDDLRQRAYWAWVARGLAYLALLIAILVLVIVLKHEWAEADVRASDHEAHMETQHAEQTEKLCDLVEITNDTLATVLAVNQTAYATLNKTCAVETLVESIYESLSGNMTCPPIDPQAIADAINNTCCDETLSNTETLLTMLAELNATLAAVNLTCPGSDCSNLTGDSDCGCNQGFSVANATCDDDDPCTLDAIVDGVCYNRRLPAGTPCQPCTCFRNTSSPTCDRQGQCVAANPATECMGNCVVDADCPNLGFLLTPGLIDYEDNDQVGLPYWDSYCHRNQSVCIYAVKQVLFAPRNDFTVTDCPHSLLARKMCTRVLDPTHPLTMCLNLDVGCATIGGVGLDMNLYCLWHFTCAQPTTLVYDYEIPGV